VARGRFPILGSGQIYYHLTYIDDLVEGLILCGARPAAANRTYILAGGEVTTLNELVDSSPRSPLSAPPWLRLPVWPFWVAGAICEAVCVPFGIEPPLYRRRVDFLYEEPRVRHRAGAAGAGLRPPGRFSEPAIARTLEWYRAQGLALT